MAENKSIKDDGQLEREADAMAQAAVQASAKAQTAIDRIKRLEARAKVLKKELKDEPE